MHLKIIICEESMDRLVSVIMPLYNSEQYVIEAIESVKKQTYDEWEMIIVDDCSTDQSALIVDEYAKRDKRIKFIHLNRNSGAAVARNVAIEKARGNYIAFLDADDQWHEDKLEKQIGFMEEQQCSFSFTNYQQILGNGRVSNKLIKCPARLTYQQQLKYNHIGCLTAIYNADKIGKTFMPLIRKRQDYALWLSILKRGVQGYGLQQCLAYYRIRGDSLSANKIAMLKWNWLLYRDIEKLSILRSSYYLLHNIIAKFNQ